MTSQFSFSKKFVWSCLLWLVTHCLLTSSCLAIGCFDDMSGVWYFKASSPSGTISGRFWMHCKHFIEFILAENLCWCQNSSELTVLSSAGSVSQEQMSDNTSIGLRATTITCSSLLIIALRSQIFYIIFYNHLFLRIWQKSGVRKLQWVLECLGGQNVSRPWFYEFYWWSELIISWEGANECINWLSRCFGLLLE